MKDWPRKEHLRRYLRSPALMAMMLKIVGAVLSFIATLTIARSAGAVVSGEFGLGVQTTLLVSAFALAGLDQIVVRTVAGDLREKRPELAGAAIRQAARFVAVTSVVAAVLLFAASPLTQFIGARWYVFAWAAVALLTYPLLRIYVQSLRATGRLIASQALEGPAHQGVIALLAVLAAVFGVTYTAAEALAVYAVTTAAATVLAWALLRRTTTKWPTSPVKRHESPGTVGLPIVLAISAHMGTAWALMALIGASEGPAEVGAFRVAVQIITIIAMLLTTVESIMSPQFAGDFRTGDHKRARQRHRRATALQIFGAGPAILVCLIFPRELLALFGPEFLQAEAALRVLVIGQAVNVMTGPIGSMMVMSGRERLSLVFAVIGFVLGVGIAALTIPTMGLLGAAWGHAVALIFRNVASYAVMMGWTPAPVPKATAAKPETWEPPPPPSE